MNIPLEINLNGYIYNRFGAFKNGCLFYPSVEFLSRLPVGSSQKIT